MSEFIDTLPPKKILVAKAGLVAGLFLVAWYLFAHLPVTYQDWVVAFRPAALHWTDPYYEGWRIFNPPWMFPFLYPVALMPPAVGGGLLMLISVIAVAWYVRSPVKTIFVICSISMMGLMTLGQLDAFLLFGLMLPRGFGIPILLLKPQGVFLTILPRLNRWSVLFTASVVGLSALVWGFWWIHIWGNQPNVNVNISLFPYSVVPGLILAFYGLKRKSDALLCVASLCIAPYFMAHSMLPAVASLIKETDDWRWWAATVVGSWAYFLIVRSF